MKYSQEETHTFLHYKELIILCTACRTPKTYIAETAAATTITSNCLIEESEGSRLPIQKATTDMNLRWFHPPPILTISMFFSYLLLCFMCPTMVIMCKNGSLEGLSVKNITQDGIYQIWPLGSQWVFLQ